MTIAMDRVKYCFSTQRFQKVIDSLSEDQKGFLAKNGFEKFLGFRKFTVPMPFLEWVMGQVVTDLSQFKHRLKSFKFTRYMVQQIIGIPSGEIPIILHSGGVKISDKLSIRDAVRNLLDQHDEESFIKWFMLVALSTIICPSTQNFVNINYLPYLLDVSQINTFDWSTHVLNYILSEVKKYQGFISSKDDGKIYVGSCLPLLAVSFLFSFLTVFFPVWFTLFFYLFYIIKSCYSCRLPTWISSTSAMNMPIITIFAMMFQEFVMLDQRTSFSLPMWTEIYQTQVASYGILEVSDIHSLLSMVIGHMIITLLQFLFYTYTLPTSYYS